MNARPADAEDSAAIAALCAELGYPVSVPAVEERLKTLDASDADGVFVAVSIEGRVVGWIQAHAAHVLESGFRVEILGLVVSGNYRQVGVGRLLVETAESWASEKGAATVVVRSNVLRTESHAFYPSLGYMESKLQRVYRKILVPAPGP